jgi:hypothetical protein
MNPRAASKIRAHWGAAGSLRAEDTRQIEFLETALEDANEEVAEAAAEALTRLIRGIYPEIGQALEDAAIFVQEQRQNLLAPTAATFPLVLVRALGNAETYVRGCTIRALVRVGVPMLPDLRWFEHAPPGRSGRSGIRLPFPHWPLCCKIPNGWFAMAQVRRSLVLAHWQFRRFWKRCVTSVVVLQRSRR